MQENRITPRRCKLCQKFYYPIRKDQKYCPRCRKKKNYYKKVEHQEATCKKCGSQFIAKRSDQVFCSTECRMTYHFPKQIKNRICRRCGKPFQTPTSRQRYCSYECYALEKRKRDKEYYMEHKDELSRSESSQPDIV